MVLKILSFVSICSHSWFFCQYSVQARILGVYSQFPYLLKRNLLGNFEPLKSFLLAYESCDPSLSREKVLAVSATLLLFWNEHVLFSIVVNIKYICQVTYVFKHVIDDLVFSPFMNT